METVIEVKNLTKAFRVGIQDVIVLKDISFTVPKTEFLVIFGPSGCGKSTLLHSIIGLEVPTKGSISILNTDMYWNKDEDFRSDFRKKHIGMVYQQPNWIKSLTVLENVAFPLLLLGQEKEESLFTADKMLRGVGMGNWAHYMPSELSSGQQQKVALTRALITDPEVVIADEPTGNLDFESGQELMVLLSDLNKKSKRTIIMVTHDLEYLQYASNIIKMLDGEVVENTLSNGFKNSIISKSNGKKTNGE